MNNNEDIQLQKALKEDDRIVKYLQGEMTVEEESVFLQELEENSDLRERAIIQARMIKGMQQIDEEIAELCKDENKPTAKIVTLRSRAKYLLAIAASIIFVFFIGFKSYDYYDTTTLGKKYANTFPTSTIIRGEANQDVETELKTLFNNIAEGKDLDKTTNRLANLWQLAKQETYNNYTDYAPYIGWYLAIGYLENYEKIKAMGVLEEMGLMFDSKTSIGIKVKELKEEI